MRWHSKRLTIFTMVPLILVDWSLLQHLTPAGAQRNLNQHPIPVHAKAFPLVQKYIKMPPLVSCSIKQPTNQPTNHSPFLERPLLSCFLQIPPQTSTFDSIFPSSAPPKTKSSCRKSLAYT